MLRTKLALVLTLLTGSASAQMPQFKAVTIDDKADKVVYAVTTADVNNDKRPDIVALTNRAAYWYEAPDWKKHTIIADQTEADNVCIAAHDIDADGQIDFAVGAGWTKKGTIQWLSRNDSLDKKWNVHSIGVELWTHRMRFADVLGTGKKQLVVSPLNKSQGKGARLTAFTIPANPMKDRWQPTVLNAAMNRMHNHWHVDLDGDKKTDTLTASAEGVHLIRQTADGWTAKKLSAGQTDGRSTGAGEVKLGKARNGRLMATVEPMHGECIVAYTQVNNEWKRHVLVDDLKRGHALWLANLDSDPEDEIVFGHSDKSSGEAKGPGVFVFDQVSAEEWKRHTIDDGGVATEDLIATDLNGDGRIDIVAGGRATHNVKLYINQGDK